MSRRSKLRDRKLLYTVVQSAVIIHGFELLFFFMQRTKSQLFQLGLESMLFLNCTVYQLYMHDKLAGWKVFYLQNVIILFMVVMVSHCSAVC